MKDKFTRNIDYLRLSITDKCNLRCLYCMPEEGVVLKKHEEILTLEELQFVVRCASQLGIRKVRLTGGEPLVRKGVVDLVSMIREISAIEEISITTNGVLLKDMARQLKTAGVDRINISLDTLNPEKFKHITRGGDLQHVLLGIDAALQEGLDPVKINCVLVEGFNTHELNEFVILAENKSLHVRFIELMPIGESQNKQDGFLSLAAVKNELIKTYGLISTQTVKSNGPAEQYMLPSGKGTIGFIGALSNHFCHKCNRLRVTADGKIKPCLDSDFEIDLMDALRHIGTEEAVKEVFVEAINKKPKGHNMKSRQTCDKRLMSQIGG